MINLRKLALETILLAGLVFSPACSDSLPVKEYFSGTYKEVDNHLVIARQRKFFNARHDKYLVFEEIRDERMKDKWYLNQVKNYNDKELLSALATKLPRLADYLKQARPLKEIELEDIYEKGKLKKIRFYLPDNKVEDLFIGY
jgi:hypothetical protein